MTWGRLDDKRYSNQKMLMAGALTRDLHTAAISWSNDQLTDGRVPNEVLPMLAPDLTAGTYFRRNASGELQQITLAEVVERGIEVGLFDRLDGAVQVHDFDQYNPRRTDVLAQRARDAERVAAARANRVRPESGRTPAGVQAVPDPVPVLNVVLEGEISPELQSVSAPGARTREEHQPDHVRLMREPVPKPKPKHPPLDDDFIEEQVAAFAPRLGGLEHCRLIVDKALNHRARNSAIDQRRYLTNWLRRDAEQYLEQQKLGPPGQPRVSRTGPYMGSPQERAELAGGIMLGSSA